jgi:hypothetical protein
MAMTTPIGVGWAFLVRVRFQTFVSGIGAMFMVDSSGYSCFLTDYVVRKKLQLTC